jgi:hypothetical protein
MNKVKNLLLYLFYLINNMDKKNMLYKKFICYIKNFI